jgi:hypothetical protein
MSIPTEAIRNGGTLGRMKGIVSFYSFKFPNEHHHPVGDDPSEEAAASKLWAVYVSEAEKYDRSLVESWKREC